MSSKWVDANGNQWRFSAATNTWQALVNGRWVAKPLPAGGLKRGDVDRYKPGTVIVETMGPPGAPGAPGPMMSVQPLSTKSAPDDDDQFILADSDDSWNLRKISSIDLKSSVLNHVSTTAVNLANKTLINPRISDTIRDAGGSSVLKIEGASGSVNHLAVRSSATGNAVGLTATGSDAAINIAIDPKGAGQVLLGGVPAVTTTGTQTLTNKSLIGPSLTNPVLGDTTLSRSAAGVLAVDGNPVSVRVPVPSTLTSAGKPGYWAADGTYHYAYSGDGETHSWTKSGMSSRTASLVVAAANSPATSRAGADYVCDGTDDHLTINAAIAALPANGGRIVLMEGDYVCPGAIEVDRDNVLIEGQGHGYATVIGVGTGTVNRTAAIVAGVTKKVWHFGLKNLFINASGGTQAIKAGTGHGVVITGDSYHLENVTTQFCEGDGFHFGQGLIEPGEDVASTTISSAGDGYLLSQTTYPVKDTIAVVSTTGFADTGFDELIVRKTTGEFIYATYTGKTSTSFTGVTANYSGTEALELAEGDVVYQTGQTYNGMAINCFAQEFGGHGFYVDWHFSSCEFYLCRVQGKMSGPHTSMGDQHGFYVQGTLLKFHLCHPYFVSGFGMKIGDKYSFASGGVWVTGGEYETCARGGIQVLNNNVACSISGANFYDNGVAHEGSPWHATDIELGYFSKECKVSECLFFDGPKANVQGKNIYIIGGTNHTIEQNFFRSPGGTDFGGWSVDNVYINGADTVYGPNSRIVVRNNVMTNYNSGSSGVKITGASTNCLVESNTTDAKLIEEVASSTTPNSNGFLNNTLIPGQGAVITVLGGNSVKRDVRDVVTTINGASGAVTGIATLAGTETLTNKTISLSSNTLTGTLAQFNTALTDGDFATIAGVQTLTNKTLTSPTITGASITGSSVTGATALSMGSTTLTGTATPLFLSLGGTYGTNTAGSPANLKLKVHEDPSAAFGLGISASNLEYQVPLSGYAHRFYAGGTEVAAITSAGITASGVAVPTVSSTSTLTNKSLSGSSNTFTNIPQSAVTGLVSDLAARELAANKGQPSGYASLDSGGKVPVTQLPHSIMQYQGTWNAATNSPALADGSGDTGDVYRVTVGGSRNLGSGSITFDVGDYAIYNGTVWEKSDTTDAVASVNGYTGNISLTKSDIGLGNVDNTSDATKNAATATLTNKTLTSPRVNQILDTTHGNPVLSFTGASGGASYVEIANSPTGYPQVRAAGASGVVNLLLSPKGDTGTVWITDNSGGRIAQFSKGGGTPVNYLDVRSSASGTGARLYATGADANVNLEIYPQGSGTVRVNNVDVVTTSGSQNLTNKTLTSPAITSPTGNIVTSIDGASGAVTGVVTLTGTQTLTNKTINSPTINSPTLTTPTFNGGTSSSVTIGTDGSVNRHLFLGSSAYSIFAFAKTGGNYSNISGNESTVLASMSGNLILSSRFAGGDIRFGTVPSGGGTTDVERMKIASDGSVTIGGVPAVTTTGTQTLTNKTISGASNTITNLPASATPDAARLVCRTADGGATAENGSNTWAKIATINLTAGAKCVSLLLGINGCRHNLGSDATTLLSVYAESNLTTPGVANYSSVQIIAGGAVLIPNDGFKIISDGYGTPYELWIKKSSTYTYFNVFEISRAISPNNATVTYHDNAPWQSATPTGAVTNVSSNGVTAFGVPVVTTTGTQALTNKTLTSPTITSPTGNIVTSIDGASGAVTGIARRVVSTVLGGTGAENGANTWAKLVTFAPTLNSTVALMLGITTGTSFQSQTAILHVFAYGQNSPSDPLVGVHLLALPNSGYAFYADGFKLVNNGYGQPVELWIKKSDQYTRFSVTEISRSVDGAGTVTYNDGATWQSAEPTGSNVNVRSTGVTISGVPVVTTTATQTLTGKTLTAPVLSGTVTGTYTLGGTPTFPSTVVTTTDAQTLTNKTLTSPRMGTILDTNGATGLVIQPTAGAVNYPKIYNDAATWVAYGADGSSANINLQILPKGDGTVNIYSGGASAGYIARFNKPGSGTPVNYITFTSALDGGAPKITGAGPGTDVSLNLGTQGAGTVQANGVPVVTTTGTQALTNKTLTSPTINTPTGDIVTSIDGASGAVTGIVTLAGAQTLTNKTLTQPKIEVIRDNNNAAYLTTVPGSNRVYLSPNGKSVAEFINSATPSGMLRFFSSDSNSAEINAYSYTDANANLSLTTKGSGTVKVNGVDVVTTTGTQALTNKTLTSPTITNPTITGTPFIQRNVSTPSAPAVLGSAAATDYVAFSRMTEPVALLNCEGSNGSTTLTDSGRLAANWTAVGAAAISTAQSRWGSGSLSLNGANGTYVTPTASLSEFAFGANDFTFETWVYHTTVAGASRHYFDMRPLGGGNEYPTLLIDASGYLLYIGNGATRISSGATVVTAGQWYHIAVSRVSGVTRTFVNGTQVGSPWTDATVYGCAAFRVGNRTVANDAAGVDGYMQDIRIFNGVGLYSSTFTPPSRLGRSYEDVATADKTVALLHGNGANASAVMTDSGVLLSNWTAVGNAQISTAQSKFGGSSIVFDGTGDYLTPTADVSNFGFGTGDFTIEFWCRPTTLTGATRIIYDGRPLAEGAYPTIYLTASGGLRYFASGSDRIVGSTLSLDTWYHIAVSRSGTSTKLWVDGTQVGSTYSDSATYLSGSSRPRIGGNGRSTDTNNFIGYLQDIRITKGLARYTTTFTPPASLLPDVPVLRLPTAVGNTNRYTIGVEGAQTVLVGGMSGQTINGSATLAVAQNDSHDLVSSGSSWRLI